jgi:hypothetical protein
MREEITGRWRKCHNEEFHNLCYSSYIFRVIKPSRIRRMDMQHSCKRQETKFLSKNLNGRDYLEGLD